MVGREVLYAALWGSVLTSPSIRLPASLFVVSHISRDSPGKEQKYMLGTDYQLAVGAWLPRRCGHGFSIREHSYLRCVSETEKERGIRMDGHLQRPEEDAGALEARGPVPWNSSALHLPTDPALLAWQRGSSGTRGCAHRCPRPLPGVCHASLWSCSLPCSGVLLTPALFFVPWSS